jgi:hypothetical protein
MKPPPFSLRAQLIVVTIAAAGFSLLGYADAPLLISEKAARSIEIGMPDYKVVGRLGRPQITRYSTGRFATWHYNVAEPAGQSRAN